MDKWPEPKRRKWRLHDERLLKIDYDFDDYDPIDYLHCIGELLLRRWNWNIHISSLPMQVVNRLE